MAMVRACRGETRLALEPRTQRLLPGIPDEISMDQIAPKLSWGDLVSLSSVSRGWRHAFRSCQIFDVRLKSNTETETLVVLYFVHCNERIFIVLYSILENSCYNFSIPNLDGGIPKGCKCVILDAKLYILGGWGLQRRASFCPFDCSERNYSFCTAHANRRVGSSAVHVFDLAGSGQWKKCAEMKYGRARFASGVMKGKIYVFGGLDGLKQSGQSPVFESEVYDPKSDTWSLIAPFQTLKIDHHATALGDQLVVHGVMALKYWYRTYSYNYLDLNIHTESARTADFYSGVVDKWRHLPGTRRLVRKWSPQGIRFTAQGKVYCLLSDSLSDTIYVYYTDKNSWRKLQKFSFEGATGARRAVFLGVTFLDGELLAVVQEEYRASSCLCRSKGFGIARRKMLWQKVSSSLRGWPADRTHYLMSDIQI